MFDGQSGAKVRAPVSLPVSAIERSLCACHFRLTFKFEKRTEPLPGVWRIHLFTSLLQKGSFVTAYALALSFVSSNKPFVTQINRFFFPFFVVVFLLQH